MSTKVNAPVLFTVKSAGIARALVLLLIALFLLITQAGLAAGAGKAQVEDDQYSYYTERYWNAAAERSAAAEEASKSYAYYTERYWRAAAERAAQPVAVEEDSYAYYTERYWNAAAERSATAAGASDSYAYYTERYWQAAAARAGNFAGVSSVTN